MGHYEPSATAAELIAEANADAAAAVRELENLRAHRAALEANPDDREALAFQVERSERIVAELEATAAAKSREAARIQAQLKSVS
ncbi:hypothetical protein ACFPJ1_40885 [Kribbella qitaiheensis]|uniref:hypothetical protein n=1 Tax=Kribbella qitaiheensis TaxID=1544730 RepID=UPI00360D1AEB